MNELEILEQSIDEHQDAINRAKEKLTKLSGSFKLQVAGSGTLKMKVYRSSQGPLIEFNSNNKYCLTASANIKEAYCIRDALNRLIILAESKIQSNSATKY